MHPSFIQVAFQDIPRRNMTVSKLRPLWSGFSYFQHQTDGINWMLDKEINGTLVPNRSGTSEVLVRGGFQCDDMGLGKTTSTIIAALETGAKKILIVCPASLKINWEREIRNYSDRKILIVEGRKWGSTFDFYIINYDIIKNYHTTDNSEDSDDYKLLVNAGFELAIVDEAHYISNNTAQRTRLLNDVLER